MLKFFATDVIVSKGFDNAPTIKFSEKRDFVRFRIGAKVFDSRAEKNNRWVNLTVKGFGAVCERIRKMQLKEGACINLSGRFDEDVWEDETKNERKSMPVVIIDDIEYCSGGSGKNSGDGKKAASSQNPAHSTAAPAENPTPGNFTGFEPFGSGGSFFDM